MAEALQGSHTNRFPAALMTTASHLSTSPARKVTVALEAIAGRTWVVDGAGVNGAKATIQEAVTAATAGDRILVAPGLYDETVTVDKSLTIECRGPRGSAFIEPSAVGAHGMAVTADDVTLINIGVAGEDDAPYALFLDGSEDGCVRFRAYRCKFEGPEGVNTPAVYMDGDDNGQVGDVLFDDCEFCWATVGVQFAASTYGYPTQIFVQNSRFHNLVTAHINEVDGAAAVINLQVIDCKFDRAEDGSAPTDFIVVDNAASTGIFSGNRFAHATNEAAVLTIGANIAWVANATEAGWSTARPA